MVPSAHCGQGSAGIPASGTFPAQGRGREDVGGVCAHSVGSHDTVVWHQRVTQTKNPSALSGPRPCAPAEPLAKGWHFRPKGSLCPPTLTPGPGYKG